MLAYLITMSSTLILLLIAWVIAMSIPFKPSGYDYKQRKFWFIALGVLNPIMCILVLALFYNVILTIDIDKGQLINNSIIALLCGTLLYFLLGYLLSSTFRQTRLGIWFNFKNK
jgi:hypothetical protein